MEPLDFYRQSHVVMVLGKGGVGKTTVTAALACAAASTGLDVLLVTLDDSGGLPALFGLDDAFSYSDAELVAADEEAHSGRISGRVLTADDALLEYLADHGLGRVARRLVATGALDVVATAIPGVREMLILARLKQIEQEGGQRLIVLDAPATGHAMTFLTSSGGLADAARGGPLRSQAEQVVTMLADPARCQVLVVALAEETPINETIETAYKLEDEIGVALGPVIVNAVIDDLDGLERDPREAAAAAGVVIDDELAGRIGKAATFRRRRAELQRVQIERLSRALPLPLIELPMLFEAEFGPPEIGRLAACLRAGIEAL